MDERRNSTLNIAGPLLATGILNATAAGNTVNYNGTAAQTIKAANYYNLTSSSTGGRTLASSGTVGIAGAFTPGTNAYTTAGSTVDYNGGAQAVAVFNSGIYTNLMLSGSGAKSLQAAMTSIGGNLALKAAATTTTVAPLTIGGNLSVGDGTTLNAAGYNLTVSGTTTVGDGASGNLAIISATGTKTFSGPVTINYGGSLTESAPAQLAFGSDVTIKNGGTLRENGAATVAFAGSLLNDGAYNAGSGVHTFTGTAKTLAGLNQVIIPSLTVSGSLTNNGTLAVATSLGGSGTLTNGSNAVLNIGAASVTPSLVASAAGNRVVYSGAGQTVKPVAYSNLILSGSGDKAMASGTSVIGGLSIAPSGTAKASIGSGLTLTVGGLTLAASDGTAAAGAHPVHLLSTRTTPTSLPVPAICS